MVDERGGERPRWGREKTTGIVRIFYVKYTMYKDFNRSPNSK